MNYQTILLKGSDIIFNKGNGVWGPRTINIPILVWFHLHYKTFIFSNYFFFHAEFKKKPLKKYVQRKEVEVTELERVHWRMWTEINQLRPQKKPLPFILKEKKPLPKYGKLEDWGLSVFTASFWLSILICNQRKSWLGANVQWVFSTWFFRDKFFNELKELEIEGVVADKVSQLEPR